MKYNFWDYETSNGTILHYIDFVFNVKNDYNSCKFISKSNKIIINDPIMVIDSNYLVYNKQVFVGKYIE